MFLLRILNLFLIIGAVNFFSSVVLASDHLDIGDDSKLKTFDLTGLFVLRPTKYVELDPEEGAAPGAPKKYRIEEIEEVRDNLVFILNVNPHKGIKDGFGIFSANSKYSIFVSTDDDLVADFRIDVYFGGAKEYAFYIGSESEPILGLINEYALFRNIKVFAGRRADPEVFDRTGYDTIFETRCWPVEGLRCDDGGKASNTYSKANIGSIVVELPVKAITGLDNSRSGKLKVWAKAYKRA